MAGSVLTQITSGLTVSEQVMLADLSTPLPTNTSHVSGLTTGGGFGGGRGGGGAAGGGGAG